jgi:hypothetical protein
MICMNPWESRQNRWGTFGNTMPSYYRKELSWLGQSDQIFDTFRLAF